MAEKRRGIGWMLMDGLADLTENGITRGLAALAATFVARRLITILWTKATGKEPPSNPEDPQVSLPEALSWATLTAVTLQTARLLAVRAAVSRIRSSPDREPADAANG